MADETTNQSELYVPKATVDNLPSMVRNELAKLPAGKQEEFVEEFKRKKKSVGIAYLLIFLLGAHYAYLGSWGLQVLYWITIAGLGIWGLIDLFRLPSVVNTYNKDVAMDIMRNLKAVSG
jgi:hypothetical protein